MKRNVFALKPGGTNPFHLQAARYIPDHSVPDGFTLIFLHAMNMHKESFEPMLLHLLKSASGVRIRDAWCIENPNHGGSACLNQNLLSSPKYRENWTAAEYSRAVHSFLTSTSHGIDFAARMLVGVAQSGAAPSLLLIHDETPAITFHGLIFLDPAILPSGKASSRVLCDMFGNWAKSKRHTWTNREVALKHLSTTAFKRWHPLAVQLFVEHALHPSDAGSVTLACSPVQEAAFYLSPDADLVDRPFDIFLQLTEVDQLPIHIIMCLNDEYKGKTGEMKQTQIQHVNSTSRGGVEIVEGGHMFPQTEPTRCAQAILRVLERMRSVPGPRL